MSEQAFLDINIATESQIFNSMDGALFRRREIDPAMVDYIVGFAEKAPADAKLGLSVPIATMPQGIDVETIVSDPVCEDFCRRAADTRRKLARLFHDGRSSLVIGASFVGLSIAIADWL